MVAGRFTIETIQTPLLDCCISADWEPLHTNSGDGVGRRGVGHLLGVNKSKMVRHVILKFLFNVTIPYQNSAKCRCRVYR